MNPEEYSVFIETAVDRVEDLLDMLELPHEAAIDVLINVLIDECALKDDLDGAEVDSIILSVADGIEDTTGIACCVICCGNEGTGEGCGGNCGSCHCHDPTDITDRELDGDFDDLEEK